MCESEGQRPTADAEEVDPPRVGVGEGLEHIGDQRPLLVGLDLELLALGADRLDRAAHRRRGQVLDEGAASSRPVPRLRVATPQVTGKIRPSVTPCLRTPTISSWSISSPSR